jgi:ribonuclease D
MKLFSFILNLFQGTTLPTLGLIQIKTSEGLIYLFRTGRNRRLFTSGGLKELLENGNILKVIHASTGDCLGIYREGIHMWGLYDTALAHKVIQFQNHGISINEGYNALINLIN